MSVFSKEYEIHYFEIDKFKEATPVSLLHYFEDAAISHTEAAGHGIDSLKADKVGWVLNRWFLKSDQYPLLGQKVTVETWPSKFERFYATREFRIRDLAGHILARASSLWVFINLEKKRPLRIPAQFNEDYRVQDVKALEEPFGDIPEMGTAESERLFSVRRSDIDTNGHVNNTRYVEWMLEGIADELRDKIRLSSLEVIYKKETTYGQSVCSQALNTGRNCPDYVHRILDEDKEQELAIGRTIWSKK